MTTINERLTKERERLKLKIPEFAKIGGVQKSTQYNYENGERAPTAAYLEAIAKSGADVMYILTGTRRAQDHLVAEAPAAYNTHELEQQLLEIYASLTPERQRLLVDIAEVMRKG